MRRDFDAGLAGANLGPAVPFVPKRSQSAAARPVPRAPELSRARQLTVYTISLGLWATGAVWLIAHYLLTYEGEFGPLPHPLEFWSIAAHGAFGFASLWLIGLLWSVHIPAGWRSSRRRWSGGLMFGLAAFLIVSGYLLYYLGSADMIPIVAVLHWTIGLACPALFLLHRFGAKRAG
jgi:hypothetical protein